MRRRPPMHAVGGVLRLSGDLVFASILDAAARACSGRHTELRQHPHLEHHPNHQKADRPQEIHHAVSSDARARLRRCPASWATGASAGLPTTPIAPTGSNAATTLLPGTVS